MCGVRRVVLAPTHETRRRCNRQKLDPVPRRYIEEGIDVAYDTLRTADPTLVERGYHFPTTGPTLNGVVEQCRAPHAPYAPLAAPRSVRRR